MDNADGNVIFHDYGFWRDLSADELHDLYMIESNAAYAQDKSFEAWLQSQQEWLDWHNQHGYFSAVARFNRPFLLDQRMWLDGLFPDLSDEAFNLAEYENLLAKYDNLEEANMRILLASKRWDSLSANPFFK
ncbi:hypothetical protein [Wielerella bovis]|uniref:hypothetical protein n=1 Tax=Wielerella bovis TaxID=2917790 RepID=UPI002019B162|nr:hypothetical protein [Wielerella bovis]MCG7657128.1 hypothetical protein [Wielerella bovis]MCG7659351.1 hypothetical protein [Wielerella bovis]